MPRGGPKAYRVLRLRVDMVSRLEALGFIIGV